MAGLQGTGGLLWDRPWISSCAQADKLCLQCMPRTVTEGNGAAVSAAEPPEVVLRPAAGVVHQGARVGCRMGLG